MDINKLSWDMNPDDRMVIDVKYDGKKVMGISLYEAIESSSRRKVIAHIKECDRSPWITRWHDEMMEDEVLILKGKSE